MIFTTIALKKMLRESINIPLLYQERTQSYIFYIYKSIYIFTGYTSSSLPPKTSDYHGPYFIYLLNSISSIPSDKTHLHDERTSNLWPPCHWFSWSVFKQIPAHVWGDLSTTFVIIFVSCFCKPDVGWRAFMQISVCGDFCLMTN